MNATQLPLAPYQPSSPTSRAAASMVNVGHQERVVLGAIDWYGGLTQDEIAERTGLLRSAIAGRCNRLERLGFIKKDGVRNSRYGRPCSVYVLVNA